MKRTVESKLGILGGGQLARMLAQSAQELGLEVHILSESRQDPAAQVVRDWHKGSINRESSLKIITDSVDALTIESEFCDTDLIKKVLKDKKVSLYPKTNHLKQIQDRARQKELLEKFNIPTASYFKISHPSQLRRAHQRFNNGFVLKQRRFGYDGYGTIVSRNGLVENSDKKRIAEFKDGWIAEEFIPFKRELAISVFRNKRGEIAFTPLVESFQKNSKCLWVIGPIVHKRISGLKKKIMTMVESMNYVGTLTFELFETNHSELLVNELAPRVHNSCHYSQNALDEDQFRLHLKAILNLPLKDPTPLVKGFAMYNVLGKRPPTKAQNISGLQLHWYGKSEIKKGRKMGHINSVGSSPQNALSKFNPIKKELEK